MKISTYTPVASASITLPSGHATASANINAYGGKTDTSALDNLMKFATKIQEDKDAQSAFNAMNDYNEQMNNLLYNKENGLMHLQGSAAENVGQTYAEAEKKIRDKVLSDHKVVMRGANVALNNSLEKINIGNGKSIMQHEFKQGEVAKDITLANGKQAFSAMAQKQYSSVENVSAYADLYAMQAGERHKYSGDEIVQAEMRKARGDIYKSALSEALAKEDFNAYNNLLKEANPFLDANDRANFDKISNTKQKNMFERNIAQEAFNMFGSDKKAAYEYIKSHNVGSRKTSSNVDKVRALIGKIPFYAEDGTNCMRTMGIALKGTPYEGQINVDQAIETAGKLGQLMSPDKYVPQAGDLAVNEDGWHIVMVTENGGTIQNGKSANGVYESNKTAAQMSSDGKVKYYIRTSDYNETGGGYDPESEDRAKRQYDRLYAEQQHIEQAEKLNIYKDVTEYVENAILGENGPQQSLAETQAWVRQYAGNDLKKLREATKIVNSTYKIYGINTTKGGANLNMGAIDKVITKFTNPNDLRDWCAEYGFNATQTKQVLARFKQYYNKTGDFSIPWDNLKKELLGSKPTPRDEIRWKGAMDYAKGELAKGAKYEDLVANPSVARTYLNKALSQKAYYRGTWTADKTTIADVFNIGGYDFEPDDATGRVIVYNRDGSTESLSKEDFEARIENGR